MNGGTNFAIDDYLSSGFNLLVRRYKDSGYGDISVPVPLEQEVPSHPPILNILAIQEDDLVAQLCIFNAQATPLPVEEDFGDIFDSFRADKSEGTMLYFGKMVTQERFANDLRVIAKVMHAGAIFALERDCTTTFACVNPNQAKFYINIFGFKQIAHVDCVSGMTSAPGALLYIKPSMLKRENLNRLGREL